MRRLGLSITIWTAVLFLFTSAEQLLSSEVTRGRFKRSVSSSVFRSDSANHVESSLGLNGRGLDDIIPDGASDNTAELQKFKISYEEIPFKLDEAWTKLAQTKGFSLRGEKWFSTGQEIVYPIELMKKNKGLWPRNYDPAAGKPKPFPEAGRGSDEFKSTSLWEHVNGQTKSTTRWMSMTKSVHKSIEFSANWENGKPSKVLTQPEGRDGLDLNVIWKIQDAPNVVDTHGSLANKGPNGEFVQNEKFIPNDYLDQVEYSAFEGIPTEQIKGYFRTEFILRNPGLAEKIANGEEPEGAFVRNIDYNDKFESLSNAGARPELAGFPPDGISQGTMKKEGWEKQPLEIQPWSKYDESPQGETEQQKTLRRVKSHKDRARDFEEKSKSEVRSAVCGANLRKRAGSLCNPDTSASAPENNKPKPDDEKTPDKPIEEEGKPTTPKGDELAPFANDPEVVKLAGEISEREFVSIAASRGMVELAEKKFLMKLPEARNRLLGYVKLTSESPKFKLSFGELGKKGLAVAGVAAWGYGVVDAFQRDTTTLDRTAAVTSIVPFLGCAVDVLHDAVDKQTFEPLDTTLCVIGDGLLVSPAWPLGILVHVIRFVIKALEPPPLPTQEEMQKTRDNNWAKFVGDYIHTYLYSPPNPSSNADGVSSENGTFRHMLNMSLAIEELAVISRAADSIAIANVTGQSALKASKSNEERANIENGTTVAIGALRSSMSQEVIRRKRNVLLGLPDMLKEKTGRSLKLQAEQFNTEFVAWVTSDEMKDKYFKVTPVQGVSGTESNNRAEVAKTLTDIGKHLNSTALRLPETFDLAYILGQSKSLEGMDPLLLAPRDFVQQQVPKLEERRVNFFSLFHTLQVAQLLRGKLSEAELPKEVWPDKTFEHVRPLQLLIAMKYGRILEEARAKRSTSGGAESGGISRPDIPPLQNRENIESDMYAALVLGLSEEIVEKIPHNQQVLRWRDIVSEKVLLAMEAHAKKQSEKKRVKTSKFDKKALNYRV